jgi:uncharacterized protein (DUF433 family)
MARPVFLALQTIFVQIMPDMENVAAYISIDPQVRFGKPCLRHTRIAVQDVLAWLASGMSFAQILEDFPELSEAHIRAALAFAAQR